MDKKERMGKGLLKLGELAEEYNIPISTIRHYSNLGLIVPEEYTPGHFRLFGKEKTLARLADIQKLVGQGLSLDQVQEELKGAPMKKEILVVDDEKEVCDVIASYLEDKEVSVSLVHNGFEAGQVLGEKMPDLVILDLHLPGVDGFEICRQIKKSPQLHHTKILAITGYDSPENAQRIISCGADAYLAKPFAIDNLGEKINELLLIDL